MNGLMMRQPLLISSLLTHAERHHGDREIVSRRVEGDIHRQSVKQLAARARRLANGLTALGLNHGERLATLAWNGYRHVELYYAVSGMGAVLHTLNPRLHEDQLQWIIDNAQDSILAFDINFLPLVERLAPSLKSVRQFVILCDKENMPSSTIDGLLCYEDLITTYDDQYTWPDLDESCASSLCYTSGTTGNPKGVLYSHRSTVLHTMATALPDALNLGSKDVILPVVPMFHVNAWGLPYSAFMVGAKLVLPGNKLDGASLYELMESEGVTISAGVPTVWQGLLNHVEAHDLRFGTMRRTIVGGAACPPSMTRTFSEKYNVDVLHAWGMTELSPLGTVCSLKAGQEAFTAEQRLAQQAKQGRVVYGIDMAIVNEHGAELPWDGSASGELVVRGHWVVSRYMGQERTDSLMKIGAHQWFPTGDISTIDPQGFMQITDRAKDVIKSGGEWISSIDLENAAMAHPGVAIAACIGIPHPKWDERPMLVVVKRPQSTVGSDDLMQFLQGKVAKWWLPDDIVFVNEIPLGGTGKILKHKLREAFKHHRLPTA